MTTASNLDAVDQTVGVIHAVDPRLPVVLGGQATAEVATAELTGADPELPTAREQ